MKFLNFVYENKEQIGVLTDCEIIPIDGIKENLNMNDVIERYDALNIETFIDQYDGQKIVLDDVKICAPIPYPKRNLFCLGKNYHAHAMEMKGKTSDAVTIPDHPIYFSKTASPAIGHDEVISGHVGVTDKVDYEVELAVIIGKAGINIPTDQVKNHIFGYTIVNDISARDLQVKHVQWHRGKCLDGFAPMGPVIVQACDIEYPPNLNIKCSVNGELRQEGVTTDLIFDIDTIISDLSKGMTLLPGDIILTGTPAGVGMGFDPPKYLKSGDTITCEIEKIGLLNNILK